MLHINLLPWREEKRKRQKLQCQTVCASLLILTLLITASIALIASPNKHSAQITLLKQAIEQTNQKLSGLQAKRFKKNKIELRLHQIARIEQKQQHLTEIMWLLQTAIPKSVTVERLNASQTELRITGRADDNRAITRCIQNLSQIDRLTQVRLKETIIKEDSIDNAVQFMIIAQFKPTEKSKV